MCSLFCSLVRCGCARSLRAQGMFVLVRLFVCSFVRSSARSLCLRRPLQARATLPPRMPAGRQRRHRTNKRASGCERTSNTKRTNRRMHARSSALNAQRPLSAHFSSLLLRSYGRSFVFVQSSTALICGVVDIVIARRDDCNDDDQDRPRPRRTKVL